mmetsp:Transcript_3113/g.3453  ORF Transcript_3113/g.3453 Transcript_3113/m.3453 type:complete len:104 (-) Transcript_3113:71-382(-)
MRNNERTSHRGAQTMYVDILLYCNFIGTNTSNAQSAATPTHKYTSPPSSLLSQWLEVFSTKYQANTKSDNVEAHNGENTPNQFQFITPSTLRTNNMVQKQNTQ